MSNKGPKFKFPCPDDYKASDPAIFCPADRVLSLYNQDSGGSAQRISKTVREWIRQNALGFGWAGVHFLPEVQSNHGAGCILWRRPQQINLQVTVTKRTLVLVDDSDSDEDDDA